MYELDAIRLRITCESLDLITIPSFEWKVQSFQVRGTSHNLRSRCVVNFHR